MAPEMIARMQPHLSSSLNPCPLWIIGTHLSARATLVFACLALEMWKTHDFLRPSKPCYCPTESAAPRERGTRTLPEFYLFPGLLQFDGFVEVASQSQLQGCYFLDRSKFYPSPGLCVLSGFFKDVPNVFEQSAFEEGQRTRLLERNYNRDVFFKNVKQGLLHLRSSVRSQPSAISRSLSVSFSHFFA